MNSISAEFPRTLNSLERINSFIDTFAHKTGLDERTVFETNLAIEELFTNAVKYVKNNRNPVSITLALENDCLEITIIDRDVEFFDIRMKEDYDFRKKIEERKVGGLGIPLIHKMMDEVDYQYENGSSIITLKKFMEKTDVSDHDGRKSVDT